MTREYWYAVAADEYTILAHGYDRATIEAIALTSVGASLKTYQQVHHADV